ncbi:MAG TPA: hypothetical protein DEF43_19825 [Chloroflexus aurantiacus]|nr:MAG: hypothetical protein D6716_17300 [Chloroflexota bacterium]HBW69353.1 hypothetical protein [Chloroflexus aurantiacus]
MVWTSQVATFVTTETRRTQSMWITRMATVRRDIARPWELTAPQIIHAVTLYGVEYNVVLFILAASLRGLLTA